MAEILASATELASWVITIITAFINMIVDTPVILVLFMMMLVSFAVGLLFRIWRSTGV